MAFLWSDFIAYWVENRRYMPPAVARAIAVRGCRRVIARQVSGRADCPLLFDDLVDRIEAAVGGASAGTPFPPTHHQRPIATKA